MHKKNVSPVYKLIKWLVKVFYPRIAVQGGENLPDEPVIVVGNHAQMNGPICCELYFPVERYTWCAGQMMDRKEVPAYAFNDFWANKPKYIRWFYKLLSYIIAPLSQCVFQNAQTIGVYHDARILSTFKNTVKKLEEGASVVIFPEGDAAHNHIIHEFQDRFIDVAKLYYKKTGKQIAFVPLYIAPELKTMYLGKPIRYCADAPIDQERKRICTYLMQQVTDMAVALPEHKVVPFKNIPRRDYPSNKACDGERTGSKSM